MDIEMCQWKFAIYKYFSNLGRGQLHHKAPRETKKAEYKYYKRDNS